MVALERNCLRLITGSQMTDDSFVVEREIEDVTFSQSFVEEIRQKIKKDQVDEFGSVQEQMLEDAVEARLLEIAKQRTLNNQGDCRLHLSITHNVQ